MSEFLMVVPEGWIELQDVDAFLERHSADAVAGWISSELVSLDTALGDDGILPPGWTLTDARMFRDGLTFRIWYKQEQVPGWGE